MTIDQELDELKKRIEDLEIDKYILFNVLHTIYGPQVHNYRKYQREELLINKYAPHSESARFINKKASEALEILKKK